MTGPRVMTGAEWSAAQYAPASSLTAGDPAKATTNGYGRVLTGDEWAQAQRMTPKQITDWKIPALPAPRIVSDVTKTPIDAALNPSQGKQIGGLAGVLTRQLVDPVLAHPFVSAGVAAAPFALPGLLGAAAGATIAGAGVYHIAQYGWQKLAESQLDPETRKLAEADPERISGEAAAVQAAMLGLGALIHVGSRATDFSAGMTEAGARGLRDADLGPRFGQSFIDAERATRATSRFAAQLEAGARGATPVDVRPVKGLEVPVTARVGRVKPIEGLEVPTETRPGRVRPIETEPASAGLQERADIDAARRDYEAQRVAEDQADIAAARLADTERVLGLREPEQSMVPRRRPGGVKSEPAPYFESPQGAEVLGMTAARHGLPADANPYHPASPLAPEWEAGHQAATQSYPLYPEGFAMGGAESRIPPDYTPTRPRGFEPTIAPEGATAESAQLAAALRPSRFRGHSTDELVQIARSARQRIETAQAQLDAVGESLERGAPVRDENGKIRANLKAVATDDLQAELQRLMEQNAAEEAAHAGVQESGYRADYEALPATEKRGHKGKEDLPDADGAVDPERLLADNKTVADYNRRQVVRAAREKAMARLQQEIAARAGESSFDFGLNASAGDAEQAATLSAERAVTRAKGTLAQVEREFALRGVTGDRLAEMIGEPPRTTNGLAPVEGTGELQPRGLSAGVEQKALTNKLDLALGDVPQYRAISMADQAERAAAFLRETPDLALQVAKGDTPAPRDLLPESVFVAVENKAIAEGDVTTLRELATGKLSTEATTMGQRIRALGERDPDSPVAAIQEVINTRTGGNAAHVAQATASEVAAIQQHMGATPIKPKTFLEFLESIEC